MSRISLRNRVRVAPQEEAGELRDVLGALTQRRYLQPHDVEPVEQILAEPALLHGLVEIDVGCGDQAKVRLHRARAADAFDFALLDRAQQLRLQLRAEVAHLVEEQRAARGELELADLLPDGAGERALLVAEEDALHELTGDRRQVHGDERTVRPLRPAVDQPRQQFLARAALAEYEDGGREFRHALHQIEDAARVRAGTGDELAVRGLVHLGLQAQHLAAEILALERVRDQGADLVAPDVLGHEMERAELHRLHRRGDVRRGRGHDDFGPGIILAEDAQQLEAGDARLVHVHQGDIHFVADQQRQRPFGARGAHDAVVLAQRVVERLARQFVRVDDEQGLLACGHGGSGRRSVAQRTRAALTMVLRRWRWALGAGLWTFAAWREPAGPPSRVRHPPAHAPAASAQHPARAVDTPSEARITYDLCGLFRERRR